MSTTDLHPAVLHHIVNTLGWPGLRPLQEEAIQPILRGDDALLLAWTAGGKTEAASFPILTRAANEGWRGLSVLYVCPLRALLNNLEPRLNSYAEWLGRRAQVWHGDTGQSKRQKILANPPDILLTTPESLEAMLVSTKVNPREHFATAIIVDEVHAFAGDDRGWHLLAVLERLEKFAGHPIQRIGLSATVGNPDELLAWLQGSAAGGRGGAALDGCRTGRRRHLRATARRCHTRSRWLPEQRRQSHLDAPRWREATRLLRISARGRGARPVTSRARHHHLRFALVAINRRTASCRAGLRRGARLCDRLHLNTGAGHRRRRPRPRHPDQRPSISRVLPQRLGRTGRRPGAVRNALFLTTTTDGLLQAAGLLLLWSRGFVESVVAPPSPRHIAAQQLLALCLQEGRVGANVWRQWWDGLPIFDEHADEITDWLVESLHLESDGGMLFIGPEAEQCFGRRNFMDIVSVFTTNPEFTVLQGREELGKVDPIVLTRKVEGPRIIVLAARSWEVTYIDWKRQRCYVEPSDIPARMRWMGDAAPLSFALARTDRDVLLGDDPTVTMSKRATDALEEIRADYTIEVSPRGLVLLRENDDVHWWTWAGTRANGTLIARCPTSPTTPSDPTTSESGCGELRPPRSSRRR